MVVSDPSGAIPAPALDRKIAAIPAQAGTDVGCGHVLQSCISRGEELCLHLGGPNPPGMDTGLHW